MYQLGTQPEAMQKDLGQFDTPSMRSMSATSATSRFFRVFSSGRSKISPMRQEGAPDFHCYKIRFGRFKQLVLSDQKELGGVQQLVRKLSLCSLRKYKKSKKNFSQKYFFDRQKFSNLEIYDFFKSRNFDFFSRKISFFEKIEINKFSKKYENKSKF